MAVRGELARSADMTTKSMSKEGKMVYNLTGEYYVIAGQEGPVFKTDVILKHFLTPLPPRFSDSGKKKALAVACGDFHLLVSARTDGGFEPKVYSSGLNNFGQLGHGDTEDRHELTPVRFVAGGDMLHW